MVAWAGKSGEPFPVLAEELVSEAGADDVEERCGECHVVGVRVHLAELKVSPADVFVEAVVVKLQHSELGVMEDGES